MTKRESTPLPDHVGIHLFRAYEAWLGAFVDAMNKAGHDWFTQGRANVLGLMERGGTRQSVLLDRSALTKQALQQMLDGLERHGVIIREVDPADKRGRIIRLTEKGQAALADADRIKMELSARYRDKLGADGLDQLQQLLVVMIDR